MERKLVCGAFQPGLEDRLTAEVRSAKEADIFFPLAVVVGSRALGFHITRLLARELGALLNVQVITFHDLAARLSAGPAPAPLHPQAPAALRAWLVRALTFDLPDDHYFSGVSRRPGLAGTLLATFDDISEAAFTRTPSDEDIGLLGKRGELRRHDKVRQVFELYRAYRAKLSVNFSDRSDLFEAAASRAGEAGSLPADRFVFYGIYDLNPLQKRLFSSICGAADVLYMLPFEDGSGFDYARSALAWLEGLGFAVENVAARPAPVPPTSLGAVQAGRTHMPAGGNTRNSVETEDRDATREGPDAADGTAGDGTFTIISAPGEAREVREIAREVLRCARVEGVPFNETAVLLRSPAMYRNLLAAEFERQAIPYYLSGGLPLAETREGRGFLVLCDLVGSGYPRRQVIDLLRFLPLDGDVSGDGPDSGALDGLVDSPGGEPPDGIADAPTDNQAESIAREPAGSEPGARPPGAGAGGDYMAPASPDLWNLVSAKANIVGGRAQWKKRLVAYVEGARVDESAEGERDAAGESLRRSVKALIDITSTIFDALDALPAEGAAADITEPLLGLYLSLTRPSEDRHVLEGAVRELAAAAGRAGTVSLEGMLSMIREHLASSTTRRGRYGDGVNVLSVMEARGTRFHVVFVPGMVEKAFPAWPSEDPVLLDGERAALNSPGTGELSLKKGRAAEERLLFTLASRAAGERLVLSFPRLEPGSARPRLPGVFVLRSAEAVTGRRVNYEMLESTPGFRRVQLAAGRGVEAPDALSPSELRVSLALSTEAALSASARCFISGRGTAPRALALLDSRYLSRSFGEFDGVLEGFDAGTLLSGGTFRATELERYTRCPYSFFCSRVLGLETFGEPEETLAITPATRGHLVHSILREFYSRCAQERLLPLAAMGSNRHREILAASARKGFELAERTGECGLQLPWKREKATIMTGLELLLEDAYRDTGGYVPEYFEVSFGRSGDDLSELVIELDGERTVSFRGRIDRVDPGPEGGSLRVVDYKTGRVRQDAKNPFLSTNFKDYPGLYFQAMIYLLAASQALGGRGGVLPGPDEGTGLVSELVFPLSAKGRVERLTYGGAAFNGHVALLADILSAVGLCLGSGLFFAYPSKWCDYCDYAPACPADRQMIFGRKSDDRKAQDAVRMLDGGMFTDG